MKKQTKAARIMKLYNEGGRTLQEIALIVGCSDTYVRVVARQRKGSSYSEHDLRYMAKSGVKEKKRAAVKAWRSRQREASHAS